MRTGCRFGSRHWREFIDRHLQSLERSGLDRGHDTTDVRALLESERVRSYVWIETQIDTLRAEGLRERVTDPPETIH